MLSKIGKYSALKNCWIREIIQNKLTQWYKFIDRAVSFYNMFITIREGLYVVLLYIGHG